MTANNKDRTPRKVYGEILYQYCLEHNIHRLVLRRVNTGYYPDLGKQLSIGQLRQGLIYLKLVGKVQRDNSSNWIILTPKKRSNNIKGVTTT